ncbi:LysR substrate-binding domain-containing protein [Streptomyces hoynatensis]|uniref:LysR family transcriptional regulator n=1 Tax=Streptomyces hoynatensis TaxID=1141874 RepID=A0A3A9ZF65_9ACTN|nr:LysR substrate-binding domain-containing protein [Streptomyces hoynatensis]RKN46943.1 LysR family transcriptional regulator [Streptomyces hoynatensis]
MDLSRHLRHFLAVAEELHFGRAAELLGMAQPPLSQSVQRLERELGVELFDRSRRSIALTAAGRALVGEARALLAAERRLRTTMAAVREGTHGTLRVGVPPEVPATRLREVLRRLAAQAPGLDVELRELTSAEQLRALADPSPAAGLDVGLVRHPVPEGAGLRFGPAVTESLGVALPRASPLARGPACALADLAGHDLILFPRAAAPEFHDQVLDACRRGGFEPPRVREARNPDFLLGLVMAERGVALVTEELAAGQPRVAWRPLAGEPLPATLSAAWPARAAHPAAERFAALAAEVLSAGLAPAALAVPGAPPPWSVVFGSR